MAVPLINGYAKEIYLASTEKKVQPVFFSIIIMFLNIQIHIAQGLNSAVKQKNGSTYHGPLCCQIQ